MSLNKKALSRRSQRGSAFDFTHFSSFQTGVAQNILSDRTSLQNPEKLLDHVEPRPSQKQLHFLDRYLFVNSCNSTQKRTRVKSAKLPMGIICNHHENKSKTRPVSASTNTGSSTAKVAYTTRMLKQQRDALYAHINENRRPSTSSSELYYRRLFKSRQSQAALSLEFENSKKDRSPKKKNHHHLFV